MKCKFNIEKPKVSNCQECPYFDDCYIEQLERIEEDGKINRTTNKKENKKFHHFE